MHRNPFHFDRDLKFDYPCSMVEPASVALAGSSRGAGHKMYRPDIQKREGRCLFSDAKCIIKRSTRYSGHLSVMDDNEPAPEEQSPVQRAVVIASIACFASLMLFYWVARPAIERLEIRWAKFLVCAIIPMAVTFIILYRSCWHREITGAARTCSLLLLSCVILGGELIAIGFMLGLAWFCVMAISGGNH
jgi:hypothetical protein